MALTGSSSLGNRAETALINAYTAQTTPASWVPLTTSGGGDYYFYDESGLLYLIRMYRDVKVLHLPVGSLPSEQRVLSFIQSNQVSTG